MASLANRRLMKELNELRTKGTPPGIELLSADSMDTWLFSIQVLGEETIYQGETFALKINFPNRYPIEVPQVTYVSNDRYQAPVHPHIYSNGHICASILEWSPVLTAVAICITMQSMLASNTKRERPKGNDNYVRNAPADSRQTRWMYDDDTV